MGEHTPTPWTVYTLMGSTYPSITSPSGDAELGNWMVAERVRWNGDAAFIVQACNSHDALVAAAQRALRTLKAQGESIRPKNVLGALDAALKLARGEQS